MRNNNYNNSQSKEQLLKQLAELLKDESIQDEIPSSLKKQALQIIQKTESTLNSPHNTTSQFLTTKKHIDLPQKQDQKNITQTKSKATIYKQPTLNKQIKQNKQNKPIVTRYVKLLNSGVLKTIQPNKQQQQSLKYISNTTMQPKSKSKSTKRMIPYRTLVKQVQKKPLKSKSIQRQKPSSSLIKKPVVVKKTNLTQPHQDESIGMIYEKQRQIENEKNYLQQKIAELKHLIDQEKNISQERNKHKNIANQQTTMLQKSYESLSNNFVEKRKLNENFKQQQKQLNQILEEVKNQKSVVDNAITQQSEIVSMYKIVIEELKNQIRNESKAKNNLKNEFLIANNTLEKLIQKFQLLYDKTEMLIHNIDRNVKQFLN